MSETPEQTWICGGCGTLIAPHSVCCTCTPEAASADPTPRLRAIQERYASGEAPSATLSSACARYIANAREDIQWLLAELARLTQESDEARRELDAFEADCKVWEQSTANLSEQLEVSKQIHAAAEAERETLRGYVQHKFECAKRSRETNDGLRVSLEPWLADKQNCTCGLASCLTLSTPKEP